jgi:hypothetical protein
MMTTKTTMMRNWMTGLLELAERRRLKRNVALKRETPSTQYQCYLKIDCNYSPNHTMVTLTDLIPLVRLSIKHPGYASQQLRFLDRHHLY